MKHISSLKFLRFFPVVEQSSLQDFAFFCSSRQPALSLSKGFGGAAGGGEPRLMDPKSTVPPLRRPAMQMNFGIN